MKQSLRIINSLIVIALSFAFLWHFSNIWLYGQHLIQEPSSLRLYSETILLALIALFGLFMFVLEVTIDYKGRKEK